MLLSPARYKIPIWPNVFVARNIQGIHTTHTFNSGYIISTQWERRPHPFSVRMIWNYSTVLFGRSAFICGRRVAHCATVLYVWAPTPEIFKFCPVLASDRRTKEISGLFNLTPSPFDGSRLICTYLFKILWKEKKPLCASYLVIHSIVH